MTGNRPRVVLVEDQPVVRTGFGLCHPDLDVVATFSSAEDLVQDWPAGADLIVLDLQLRQVGGAQSQGGEAVRLVASGDTPVCLYTSETRRLVLMRCLQAGARGVVHKGDPVDEATRGFLTVAAGGSHITPTLVGLAELLERHGELPELSLRQRQILSARSRGEKWDSIARRLFITSGVAREHMDVVVRKFADHVRTSAPADLERALGLAPGDLLSEP